MSQGIMSQGIEESRRPRGFTLIELMIVIAIIAAIASMAIPNLLAARLSSNEAAAIASLRTISSAQAQFQQGGRADTDADGTGEYGGFRELAGGAAGRMASILRPSVLSGSFWILNAQGHVSRSGYLFQVHLPAPDGSGVAEPQVGYADDGTLDGDFTETTWCCYAWPVNYNQSGNRTFFVNQAGSVLACEDGAYSASAAPPAGEAAFQSPGIDGLVAVGATPMNPAQDGNVWKQVN